MAIKTYPNDYAGRTAAAAESALLDSSHVWRDQSRVIVFTGGDAPSKREASSLSEIEPPIVGPVYAIAGQQLNIYWPALVNGYGRYGFGPQTALTSNLIRNGMRVDHPAPAMSLVEVEVHEIASASLACVLGFDISVINAALLDGKTISVCCVGDSLTAGAHVALRMSTLATAMGFTIVGIGTQDSPNLHEGNGGWSWASYVNPSGSPFYTAGVINFPAYFAGAGGVPDVMTWHLGTNEVFDAVSGLSMGAALAAAAFAATESIAHAEFLLASVAANYPNMPHVVFLPPLGSYGPEGFGYDYGVSVPQHIYHAAMGVYRRLFAAAFAGRESEGIFLVELGALVDPENGAQKTTVAISDYNAATRSESSNGVHFSLAGYVELSAAMLPAVCRAYLAIPSTMHLISYSESSPYVRTWEYTGGALIEYDGAAWDPESSPGGTGGYQSDARGGYASPANANVDGGQLVCGSWVADPSGSRPTRSATPLTTAVHPNGLIVIDGLNGAPWIRINRRDRVGGEWSTVDTSAMPTPANKVYALSFSPDGTKLAVGRYSNDLWAVYDFDPVACTLSNKVEPDGQVTGPITGIAWSPDGQAIVVCVNDSPYFAVYKYADGTYTKISNPASLPGGRCRSPQFSPDGTKIATGVWHSNSLLWYDYNGASLVKRTNPASMPTGNVYAVCWIDDTHLAVGHAGTTGAAYLASYTVTGGLLELDSAPTALTALNSKVTTLRAFQP